MPENTLTYCFECTAAHLTAVSGLMDEAIRLGLKDQDIGPLYDRIPKILEQVKELEEYDLSPEFLEKVKVPTKEFLTDLKTDLRDFRKYLAKTDLSKGGGKWEDLEEALEEIRTIRDNFFKNQPAYLSIEGECPTCRVAQEIAGDHEEGLEEHIHLT